MQRVIDIDMEVKGKNFTTVLDKFFKKYPELSYWRDQFEYMYENNEYFCCDDTLSDGSRNKEWRYALHLDVYEEHCYLAIIERT